MGLGLAALFMLRNRGASEEVQASQLAGAAMMASGEGTAPDAPFQEYSAPANPVVFRPPVHQISARLLQNLKAPQGLR
jgi:hypothetical protein